MILYHYTLRENLFGIAMSGLTPRRMESRLDFTTMGQKVVWLTRQETMKPTQGDLDYFVSLFGEQDGKAFAEDMLMGRDTRLTVKLSTASKKLVHYHTWLTTTKIVALDADNIEKRFTGSDVAEKIILPPSAKEHWWVYFGTIKPARIDLPVTPETMLPGVEFDLASAIQEGDAGAITRLTKTRDRMKSLPLDEPIRLKFID